VKITLEMIAAARLAQAEYFAKRSIYAAHVTPDAVIKAMLTAAFAHVSDEVAATVKPAAIVIARKPGRWR
jgi:hypothetical protein